MKAQQFQLPKQLYEYYDTLSDEDKEILYKQVIAMSRNADSIEKRKQATLYLMQLFILKREHESCEFM